MSPLFTGCSAALHGGAVEAAGVLRGVRRRGAVPRQRCCLHVAAAAAEHRRGSRGRQVPRGGVSVQRERSERLRQSAPTPPSQRGPGDNFTAGNSSSSAESDNAANPNISAASSALAANSSPSTETNRTTHATTPFELDGMGLFSGADFGASPPPRRRVPASSSSSKSSKRRSPPAPPLPPAPTTITTTTRAKRLEEDLTGQRSSHTRTGATRAPSALAPAATAHPSIDAVIVVEGANDVRAVTAAVNPRGGTIILKGSYNAKMGHYNVSGDVMRAVSAAAAEHSRIIVLTDSDTAGRQLRSRIVQEVPGALHAFLGTHESSATGETKYHKPGNVGVEHAAPEAIRRALDSARPAASIGGSAGVSREMFTRVDLARWGLCGPLGESAPDARWKAFGGVAARRRLVGEYLGVGDCDAKQLLRQMNLFFSAAEVDAAVESLPGEGEAIPAKMTDGGADRKLRGGSWGGDGAEDSDFDLYAYVPPGHAPPGFR